VLDVLKFYTDQDKRRSAETSRSIKFNIAGKVMGKDVMETEVTKFMLALEQSGYFGNISVVIKGKVSLQGNVINREQRSRFRNGESSEGELRQLPFVIDGDIQKDRSGRIR
jgi:hypothetical protein